MTSHEYSFRYELLILILSSTPYEYKRTFIVVIICDKVVANWTIYIHSNRHIQFRPCQSHVHHSSFFLCLICSQHDIMDKTCSSIHSHHHCNYYLHTYIFFFIHLLIAQSTKYKNNKMQILLIIDKNDVVI